MQLITNHFIPDLEAKFGKNHVVCFYLKLKRTFFDLKKDNEKADKKILAMVYPQHMLVIVTSKHFNLYNSSFFGGEMDSLYPPK